MLHRLAVAALCLVCVAAAPASSDPTPGNVHLTFEIGQSQGSHAETPRVYQVVSMLDGKVQSVYGGKIPLPAMAGPNAGYSYQNVGVTLNYATRQSAEGAIELDARIEGTLLPPSDAPADRNVPPAFGTFSHDFHVLLANGKTVRVIDVGETDKARHYLDVRADVLR
jgi:hypothetical protein